MKTCGSCGVEKTEQEFSRNGKRPRSKCKDCCNSYHKQWREINPLYFKKNCAKWRNEHIDMVREKDRQKYKEDRENYIIKANRYYHENKDKIAERRHVLYLLNKEEHVARARVRDRRVRQSTPSWADLPAIKAFYKNRPKGCHVDHIVPIKGKNVCGLHVPWNLQYLPASVNRKKSNHT